MFLSKSLFIMGLQCHKALYLRKYHPELRDKIPPERQALFDWGHKVGKLAQKLFPGGIEIPFDGLSIEEQLLSTRQAIADGKNTIYEASFSHNDVFIKADILHKEPGGWVIYEVKSATDLKDVYVDDVSIQFYVLSGAGLPVSKVFLVHINNEYVRQGKIDVTQLFVAEDLTEIALERQAEIETELARMREMLAGGMPAVDIEKHCWEPNECDFQGFCWQHIPYPSVFDLKGRGIDKFDLYRRGFIEFKDIPEKVLPDHQRTQLKATLEKRNFINKDRVKEFLNTLWYPLAFLDFETTFMLPIPLYDGTKPYQPVPFQYSLHVCQQENADLEHYEYLAQAGTDPRRELLTKLLSEIPPTACILTYNMHYEKGILEHLKGWFPEYAEQIDRAIENLRDLMVPFKHRDIYYWNMNGSYSLKAVLPALVPELTYEDMEISGGQMASFAWMDTQNMQDEKEIERIRRALLSYCKMDTLGMVKIIEAMKKICKID